VPNPYTDPNIARQVLADISRLLAGQSLRIMEVCGTHTVALFRTGLRAALGEIGIKLLSGPGCPVCVTPKGVTDAAIAVARIPGVELVTFGDMMRVPGSVQTLSEARAKGVQVRVVYSPHDILALATSEPNTAFVFLAVGFETTLPTIAAMLTEADEKKLSNIFILPAGKYVPPALRALFAGGKRQVDALLLPGHVCTVLGSSSFKFVADELGIPSAIAGFELVDILLAVRELAKMRAEGRTEVANSYARAVTKQGNPKARQLMDEVFTPAEAEWRGLGTVPASGAILRPAYRQRDALVHFSVSVPRVKEEEGCLCGSVLLGDCDPPDCPLFGSACTPERAIGACMVSTEGSCAAWFKYGR
jgi:hydrogenase expression/formation protein HypD